MTSIADDTRHPVISELASGLCGLFSKPLAVGRSTCAQPRTSPSRSSTQNAAPAAPFRAVTRRWYIRLSMLTVTFLGTSAARPTVERNVSGLAVHREGETLLFECGEGTQRQMMRYGVSFALSEIFFTHFHADHFLGVIGLIRTLGLQGRPEPLFLFGPKGAKKVLSTAMQLGVERVPFPVEINEVKAGDTIGDGGRGKREGYDIYTFPTEHGGGPSFGYVIKEQVRRGRCDFEKAKAAGIPEAPRW